MIDFASVTGIQIPEGSANALTIGGQPAWSVGDWDLSWVYHGALPPSNIWITGDASNAQNEGAIRLNQSASHAYMYPRSTAFQESNKCIFETEIKVVSSGTPNDGVTIQLAGLTSSDPAELRARIWTGTGGTTLLDTSMGVINFSLNQWHTVRLELDITGNKSVVYLDEQDAVDVPNGFLYMTENNGPSLFANNSDCYVRAMRYKAL